MRTLAVLGVVLVTVGAQAFGQQTPVPAKPPYVDNVWLVVSKQQPGVTLYNARTDAEICKARTGVSPHEAAFSADGRLAFIPVYGNSNQGQPGTNEHAIHIVNTSDCSEVAIVDTGDHTRPHGIVVGKSGLVYATSENKQSVIVIDPQKRGVVGTIPTGSQSTHFLALTADETKAFTSNVGARTISVLDIPGRALVKTIDTSSPNQRVAISPNQQWFTNQLGQNRSVTFYRVSDTGIDFSVAVEGSPFTGAFSADNRYYFVMGSVGGGRGAQPPQPPPAGPPGLRVWKIDLKTRAVIATSSEALGTGAGGLAINPVNGRVYLSSLIANQVSVLDPETLKVVKQIATEPTPDGIYFGATK